MLLEEMFANEAEIQNWNPSGTMITKLISRDVTLRCGKMISCAEYFSNK